MRLSGGLSRTTRQCEGVTRSSLTCAAFVAEGMTLLDLGRAMTCDCMLSRGARARVRAMPGSGPLVCRRTPGQVAPDDARGVIVAEHLQELRSPVRFERPAGRLRQTQRVG